MYSYSVLTFLFSIIPVAVIALIKSIEYSIILELSDVFGTSKFLAIVGLELILTLLSSKVLSLLFTSGLFVSTLSTGLLLSITGLSVFGLSTLGLSVGLSTFGLSVFVGFFPKNIFTVSPSTCVVLSTGEREQSSLTFSLNEPSLIYHDH